MAWIRGNFRQAAPAFHPAMQPALAPLFRPIEELITGGGDGRITVSAPFRQNAYGCTPYPQSDLIDFASSTASCISEEAYAHLNAARGDLMARALRDGADHAFDVVTNASRDVLLSLLALKDSGTQVVFAPSGTDAQLHALFLARVFLKKPITVIVAGSDQTGSGTSYTCRGRHFNGATAGGSTVEKGAGIAGLEEAEGIEVPFCSPDGTFRSGAEMDRCVLRAVEDAVAAGRGVLLQAMAGSKFGWRAPSDTCLKHITARWPASVQIVMDACQFRLARADIRSFLAKGYGVLLTGSKFFTGPAFSGALLVPEALSDAMVVADQVPPGLANYGNAYDWPPAWKHVRRAFGFRPNLGQWLRWEAALTEMRLYYDVPSDFRTDLMHQFRHAVEAEIAATENLVLLPIGDVPLPTVFAVMLKNREGWLSAETVGKIWRSLRQEQSCQLGQPVALPAMKSAALRVSLSARLVRACWSQDKQKVAGKAKLFADLAAAVKSLDALAGASHA